MSQTIQNDFILAANEFPQQMAVWSENESISYRQLDERSSALASWLLENNLAPGQRTGIILSKSVDAVVALLGALRAGNAYVPLGSTWPTNRLNSILNGGEFKSIIVEKHDKELLTADAKVVNTNTEEWQDAITSTDSNKNVQIDVNKSDLAYILYTSGSTGVPKGVCVSHYAAYHFPNWAKKELKLDHLDRIASIAPFTFDLSTFDLFSSLSAGASIYLVPEKHKLFPSRFTQFFQSHEITVIYAVPSSLSLMLLKGHLQDRDLTKMKTVLFAGEVFPPANFLKFKACLPLHVQYYNFYGPTETNVCTYYKVPDDFQAEGAIPIGLATPETRLSLRSEEGDVSSKVEEGELCVAGPTIMSGYWGKNNAELDCWADIPGEPDTKAYRTGDIVTKDAAGNCMYKGRRDKMVKIWGYRVELGEIESALLKYQSIEQAAVIKRDKKDNQGEELVAFILSGQSLSNNNLDIKDVFNHCKQHLPHFMVPRKMYELKEMPINNSGKIDRLKLENMSSDYQSSE